MSATLVSAIVIIVVVLFFIGIFNRLIRLRNLVKNSFSQIDVQLKRRYDLIPNLVETAKAYIKHERETLEAVIRARNAAVTAESAAAANPSSGEAMRGLLGAEGILGQAMTKFMALAEAYPDLKANQNMMQLTEELTSTENKVAFARQAYNDSVMEYNNTREVFPNSIVAGSFGFVPAQSFEVTNPTEKEPVRVTF